MCNKNSSNKIIFLTTVIFGIIFFAVAELPLTQKKVEQKVQDTKLCESLKETTFVKELIDLDSDIVVQKNEPSKKTLLTQNSQSKNSENGTEKIIIQPQKQEPKLEIKKEAIDTEISKNRCHGKRFVQATPHVKKENQKSKPMPIKYESEFMERVIMVSNEITDDMITYKKHWSGNHTPSKFIVMVNDQEIKKGSATPIKVKNDTLAISYNYEFKALGKVYRSGGKKLEYKVPKEVKKLTSTFSWDAPSNLVLDSCQLIASWDIS